MKSKGFTSLEFIIASAIITIIVSAFVGVLSDASRQYRDTSLIQVVENEALSVTNLMGIEFRMIGNGIPFDQTGFGMSDQLSDETDTLVTTDVQFPILVSQTDTDEIVYRINESGNVYMLTQRFDPAADSEIYLNEVTGLFDGDTIYISNRSITGDDGFAGTIDTVVDGANPYVTIDAASDGYLRTTGAAFNPGSLLEPVIDVDLYNDTANKTIVRDSGFGALVLAENASFTLAFLDVDGNEIDRTQSPYNHSDVLYESDVYDGTLRSVLITVNVATKYSMSKLENPGSPYVAAVSQVFGFKNLQLKDTT